MRDIAITPLARIRLKSSRMLYFWVYQVCLLPFIGCVFISSAGDYGEVNKPPIGSFILSRLLLMLLLSPVLWVIAFFIFYSVGVSDITIKSFVAKHIIMGLLTCPMSPGGKGIEYSLPSALIMTSILAYPFYTWCDSLILKKLKYTNDKSRFFVKWVAKVNGFVFGVQILVLIGVLVFNIINR